MCLTVLAVPDLDFPSNLVGSLITSHQSHRARLPAGKGSKAVRRVLGVPSRRRCGAASGDWVGGGREGVENKKGKPPAPTTHTALHAHTSPLAHPSWASTPRLLPWLALPSLEGSRLPDPHPFKRYLHPHRSSDRGRGAGRWPLPSWAFGRGGSCRQKSRPPGGGVESLGRGLGRGGSELEPCLSLRCRVEQMAGEGRGYVAGGRRGAGAGG